MLYPIWHPVPKKAYDDSLVAVSGERVITEDGRHICDVAITLTKDHICGPDSFTNWQIRPPEVQTTYDDQIFDGWVRQYGPMGSIAIRLERGWSDETDPSEGQKSSEA